MCLSFVNFSFFIFRRRRRRRRRRFSFFFWSLPRTKKAIERQLHFIQNFPQQYRLAQAVYLLTPSPSREEDTHRASVLASTTKSE